ncbi:MAG TPA: hypothetical protein VKB76_20525 [Ktedonobacterales bacterium]|nr:hypothetical protein [Ktedonobacterales bacterium]
MSDDYRANISQGEFQVRKDRLTGGVRIRLNGDECVVPPAMAVRMAEAILKMAGVEVRFENPAQTILRPRNGNGNGLIK